MQFTCTTYLLRMSSKNQINKHVQGEIYLETTTVVVKLRFPNLLYVYFIFKIQFSVIYLEFKFREHYIKDIFI